MAAVCGGVSRGVKAYARFSYRRLWHRPRLSAVYSILHIVLHFILFEVLWILTIIPVILTLGIIFFVVNAVILWLTTT